MRYETDINGYITCVFWGCFSGKCKEYTGEIPIGYESLADWEANAVIGAYYIDENGNLVLDAQREAEMLTQAEQEAVENAPVLRKDLFETEAALGSQNIKSGATGKVLTLYDVLNVPPIIKLTDIDPNNDLITIFAHNRNMLRVNYKNVMVEGLTIEWLGEASGFVFTGTATEAFEYTLSGSPNDPTPIFALRKGRTYSLDVGGIECEFRYFNGETTEIVYIGTGGQILLPENKKVTHVVLKIPAGFSREAGLRPTLCDGDKILDPYEPPECKTLTLDISKYIDRTKLLYPGDSTFPGVSTFAVGIDYILIKDGSVHISANGKVYCMGQGNVRLLSGFNTIYTDQFANIEMEYTTNKANIEDLSFMQGKATNTGKFEILPDGSIKAKDGFFSGELNSEAGKIGGYTLDKTSLKAKLDWELEFSIDTEEKYNYHLDRMHKIIIGEITPTDTELEMYDINGDGRISSVDTLMLQRIHAGTYDTKGEFVINSLDGKKTLKFSSSVGRATSIGVGGIFSPGINADYMSAINFESSQINTKYLRVNDVRVSDFVVEEGTSGSWTYMKWNSGIAECWGVHTVNATFAINRGNYGYSSGGISLDFPFTFVKQPVANVAYNPPNIGSLLFVKTTTSEVTFDMANTVAYESTKKVPVQVIVKGKWK